MAIVVSSVAVVFALKREAKPFQRRCRGVNTIVSGVGAEAARRATYIAIEGWQPHLVIAAGFCGALSPALAVGDIV